MLVIFGVSVGDFPALLVSFMVSVGEFPGLCWGISLPRLVILVRLGVLFGGIVCFSGRPLCVNTPF